MPYEPSDTHCDRRGFLRLAAAAAACLAAPRRLFAKSPSDFDDNLIVFLADVHAGASPKCKAARKMFAVSVAEILKMDPLPRNVLVFGDVAYTCGLAADYGISRQQFKLLEDAGITVTIGMGNHDRRSEFAKRWPEAASKSLVPGGTSICLRRRASTSSCSTPWRARTTGRRTTRVRSGDSSPTTSSSF